MPDFFFEDEYAHRGPVCGADEAGRGPWAGPVVAAAVILPREGVPDGVDDSKRLSPKRRAILHDAIRACARVSVAVAEVEEIDATNILAASEGALSRAVAELEPALALIDGKRVPLDLPCDGIGLVKGDRRSLSIAAASIIAKVTRDRMMDRLALDWPGYGWETNRGYGTAQHRAALDRLGVTPHHRRSFKPIHKILG